MRGQRMDEQMDESFIFNAPEQLYLAPFFQAIEDDDLSLINHLLEEEPPVFVEFTPLKYALECGKLFISRFLLCNPSYDRVFLTGSAPLYSHYFFAIKSGKWELVELICQSRFGNERDCWNRGLEELLRDFGCRMPTETCIEQEGEFLFCKRDADVKQRHE